ncbi:MAG: hypothetical protein QXZ13_04150 [Candidatus Diapherotrites archaeon]
MAPENSDLPEKIPTAKVFILALVLLFTLTEHKSNPSQNVKLVSALKYGI